MNIENPYKSPDDSQTATSDSAASPATPASNWAVRITIAFCVIAMAYFSFSALMLIPQAIRLKAESTQFPPQFRNSSDAIVQSSWILGISSIAMALAATTGMVFAIRKRLMASWGILTLCVVIFVILAVMYKPT